MSVEGRIGDATTPGNRARKFAEIPPERLTCVPRWRLPQAHLRFPARLRRRTAREFVDEFKGRQRSFSSSSIELTDHVPNVAASSAAHQAQQQMLSGAC